MIDDTTPLGETLDLDALLTESIQAIEDEKQLKKGKNMLASPWLKGRERDELRKSVQEAQDRQEWTPIAAVAYFHEQLCLTCGTRNTHFSGFFQEQKHKRFLETTRCVPAIDSTMLQGLPKKSKVAQYQADLCHLCKSTGDWPALAPLNSPLQEIPHATWAPHKNPKKYTD